MSRDNILPTCLILIVCLVFFSKFFSGFLPIPSDTIVGLYHPYRDFFSEEYPNGIPFKNFLITDPVRQQYPWRILGIDQLKNFIIPLWNPYNGAGTPLMANYQSALLYPLNIIFWFISFKYAWSLLVLLQVLLGGLFMYFYLRFMRVNIAGSLFGSITFIFSGFSVSWFEWNTVMHTAIWLPLILLSIEHAIRRFEWKWVLILAFSVCCLIFAGHLQVAFYSFLALGLYLISRIYQLRFLSNHSNLKFISKKLLLFFAIGVVVLVITSVQWVPTLKFISLSARDVDLSGWNQEGWFIPWKHLIQFVVPDFFGNPTTLNYWGTWNYGELTGYLGVLPLVMAFVAIFYRRDKKTLFFGTIVILGLIFALPTFLAKIPFILQIPFISTSQPTRLLFLIDFSLAVLAGLGMDFFYRRRKVIILPLILIGTVLALSWISVLFGDRISLATRENLLIAKSNLIFPSIIYVLSVFIIGIYFLLNSSNKRQIIIYFLLIISIVDLLRFAFKFTPFTNQSYLFPQTKTIEFLQKNLGNYRIMATDARIFPPNFSAIYKIQSLDLYDPLYLRTYAELIAASERKRPNINPPFGFNRIITPREVDTKIIDLLGVKYILSLNDLDSAKLTKVFQEGQTRIYENRNAFPRVFFVKNILWTQNKYDTISSIMQSNINLTDTAIMEYPKLKKGYHWDPDWDLKCPCGIGDTKIVKYSENEVVVETNNIKSGFLVLTDTYYPTWRVRLVPYDSRNGREIVSGSYDSIIRRVDLNFRGVVVPKGNFKVKFYNTYL